MSKDAFDDKEGYRSLFLEWLTEWRQEAANNHNRVQYTYANALKSLKNYPLPVFSGHGCMKLSYFGDYTCKKLEKKLVNYLKENKLQRIIGPDPSLNDASTSTSDTNQIPDVRRKPARKASPKKKSANNEIGQDLPRKGVIVIKRKSSEDDVNETLPPLPAVIHRSPAKILKSKSAQTLPSTSSGIGSADDFIINSNTSSSTTLITMSLRNGGQAYAGGVSTSLVESGEGFLAQTCSSNLGCPPNEDKDANFGQITAKEFILRPGTFDVVLCVDNQEIHGRGNTHAKLDIVTELRKQEINFDVRCLKVGDFLWIAREKIELASKEKRKSRELVLDFIAERKRGDDLAVSMKDGRYTCQKFRMKMVSLRRIIYIIEDGQLFKNKGLSDQAFHQALANLEIQDGFLVKETESLEKTADYLAMMTKYLQRIYSTKVLKSCSYSKRCEESSIQFNLSLPSHNLLSFDTFSSIAKTNQSKTVSQTFLLHLLALDGMSPAKASAIIAVYPSMRRIMEGYDACVTEQEKEILLRDFKFGSGITKIGPVISKRLHRLYCVLHH